MTFEKAYIRLEEIHRLLQSDELIDIEKILTLQEEAKECYDLCKGMLEKSEKSTSQ